MTETIGFTTGNGVTISMTTVDFSGVSAVYVDAVSVGGGELIITPTQPECDDYVAIENHSFYWCRPFFGRGLCDLPAQVQALLIRHGTHYRYILPVCADTWKTVIRGGKNGMEYRLYTNQTEVCDCKRQLAWVEASGQDPLRLVSACAKVAAALLGNGLKLRAERTYPETLEFLGWCSWDAFQIRVSEEGLLQKALEFQEKGVPVKYAIIDDMWANVPDLNEIPSDTDFSAMVGLMHKSCLRAFEGDPIRFPNGMKHAVERLKETGIRDVGIWFPTTGYWFGMEPDRMAERMFSNDLMTEPGGRRIVRPELSHTVRYFDHLCKTVKGWGAAFVKIDNQGCQRYYRTVGPIGQTARAVQTGIEAAVAEHFNGAVINCMGMPSECMFNRPNSAVSRCSDDFMPENREWFTKNVLQCAYNGILQGQFYVNDWDMWWTDDGQAKKNSLCRAISGGPIYISDKLGRTDPELLRPLCLSNGRILRPDESATPTADCLTIDPRDSGKPLKIRNTVGDTGILAAFNLDAKERPVNGSLGAEDVGASRNVRMVLYDWFGKTCRLLEAGERAEIMLENAEDYCLWWLVPYVSGGVTVLGKTDLFVGCRAVEALGDGRYRVLDGGEFAVASKLPVRLEVNGTVLDGIQDGLLFRFLLPNKTTDVRILLE